jgi:hypothetical protein
MGDPFILHHQRTQPSIECLTVRPSYDSNTGPALGQSFVQKTDRSSPRFVAGRGKDSFGVSLWWTAMLMTTLGSDHWPQTVEGCILAFFLALYALAVFGYVTASLATFFISRDAASLQGKIAGEESLAALRALRMPAPEQDKRREPLP